MTDNFKDYPKSVSELRADNGNLDPLTPRDILVSLLRAIDNGELETSSLVIAYLDKETYYHFRESTTAQSIAIALYTMGLHRVLHG